MARHDTVQAPDSEDHASVPWEGLVSLDTAFWKDAAASGLADWSRMNLNLYNFHTRLVPQSQPSAASSPFTNSGSFSYHLTSVK